MKGANEYAKLFKTGQYGQLYIRSSSHARGKTFHVYVLPEGEKAIPNYDNPPLNKNCVEVYGVVSGQPGWTETYGWLHEGKWKDDFYKLVEERKAQEVRRQQEQDAHRETKKQEEEMRMQQILSSYR